MSDPNEKLARPPIVEAVVDIDCDMPPSLEMAALEAPAREAFRDRYPKFRTVYLEEHLIEQQADAPPQFSARRGIQAFQCLHEDERQLVQVRAQGFSFNRLAPYTSLDDYLPEIEGAWPLFVWLASPLQVRLLRLRYINRILLPMAGDQVELNDYLNIAPRLPDEARLALLGFLHQHLVVERETGSQVNIILTAQPMENSLRPIIFDIEASRAIPAAPEDWGALLAGVQSLRNLKNRVFRDSLTDKCMRLFR